MWMTFVISLIGLALTFYLFKNKKWIQGTWLGCFSLAIFMAGSIQIPSINPSIQNSFNFNKRFEAIEKDLRVIKAYKAEFEKLDLTQKSGIALHVAGDALFDKSISSKAKKNEPGEIILVDENGREAWKIVSFADNLAFQKFQDGKWITKYSIPQ